MTRKTVVTCLILALCTSVGAAGLYAPSRWSALEMPAVPWKSNYIRIELPAVEVVEVDKAAVLAGASGPAGALLPNLL